MVVAQEERDARAILTGARCTTAIPPRISPPPISCCTVGCWPSSRAAKTTAKMTSVSATNDAIELPEPADGDDPGQVGEHRATRINSAIGSHQADVEPAQSAGRRRRGAAALRSGPDRPATAADSGADAWSAATGCTGSDCPAALAQHEVGRQTQRPRRAPRPRPIGFTRQPIAVRSSTRTRPTRRRRGADEAPRSVGRCRYGPSASRSAARARGTPAAAQRRPRGTAPR